MEISASAELECSTSSVDGCDSSRSSSLSCHKTGASVEYEIRPSLLDTLQSPRPSDLARKRKIHANPLPVGKKRSQAGTSARKHDPKTVTPLHRACEFPGEHLAASGGKLFCKACREYLALKRNVVVNHVKCAKYQRSKEKLLEKEAKERDLAQAIEKHDAQTQRKGETLDADTKVYTE